MLKLGLDYHGVITAAPEVFAALTKRFLTGSREVHIITGARCTKKLKEDLDGYGITYTHFFSISDYHNDLGTQMTGYDEGQPKIDDTLWDKTKADYCQRTGIFCHIDDSPFYGRFFKTPYILFDYSEEDQKQAMEFTYMLEAQIAVQFIETIMLD